MKRIIISTMLVLFTSLSFAGRAEECSSLSSEIKYYEALLVEAKKQNNAQVMQFLLNRIIQLKAAFRANCTWDA